MVTADRKTKVDSTRGTKRCGGISTPLSVIEQRTRLLLIKGTRMKEPIR